MCNIHIYIYIYIYMYIYIITKKGVYGIVQYRARDEGSMHFADMHLILENKSYLFRITILDISKYFVGYMKRHSTSSFILRVLQHLA